MMHPIPRVIEVTARHYALSVDALIGPDRHLSVAFARHVAMFIARMHTRASYPELGRSFGRRDHSTVMSAVRKIERRIPEDADLRASLYAIGAALEIGEAAA